MSKTKKKATAPVSVKPKILKDRFILKKDVLIAIILFIAGAVLLAGNFIFAIIFKYGQTQMYTYLLIISIVFLLLSAYYIKKKCKCPYCKRTSRVYIKRMNTKNAQFTCPICRNVVNIKK